MAQFVSQDQTNDYQDDKMRGSLYGWLSKLLNKKAKTLRTTAQVVRELRQQRIESEAETWVEKFMEYNDVAPNNKFILKKLLGMEHSPTFYFN